MVVKIRVIRALMSKSKTYIHGNQDTDPVDVE